MGHFRLQQKSLHQSRHRRGWTCHLPCWPRRDCRRGWARHASRVRRHRVLSFLHVLRRLPRRVRAPSPFRFRLPPFCLFLSRKEGRWRWVVRVPMRQVDREGWQGIRRCGSLLLLGYILTLQGVLCEHPKIY